MSFWNLLVRPLFHIQYLTWAVIKSSLVRRTCTFLPFILVFLGLVSGNNLMRCCVWHLVSSQDVKMSICLIRAHQCCSPVHLWYPHCCHSYLVRKTQAIVKVHRNLWKQFLHRPVEGPELQRIFLIYALGDQWNCESADFETKSLKAEPSCVVNKV